MSVLFIQGMRRSGTTVAFDLVAADPAFLALYEPFAQAKATRGGGSGIQDRDLFAPVRELRERFLASGPPIPAEELNYGAPRRPELEHESTLPPPLQEYLRLLVRSAPDVVLKFTRMAAKVAELHRAAPDAVLVHAIRDPRAVVSSYLLRPYYELRHRRLRRWLYFTWRSRTLPWSLEPLSRPLVEERFGQRRWPPADVVRVLLLWQRTFRRTHEAGSRLYGERYVLLRHEDLATDPLGMAAALYRRIDRPLPPEVEELVPKIRPPRPAYRARSRAWRRLARRLDLERDLEQAGYAEAWGL